MQRRQFLQLAMAAVAGAPRIAWAQNYPDRPVRMIVPYAPGGPTDVITRLLAQKLSDQVGKQFFVENMGGGVPDPDNKAPAVTVSDSQTVTLPSPATLVATATDDGLPKPYRRAPSNPDRDAQPRRPRGVQIKWIVYRGPGKVTFKPDASMIVHGEPVTLVSKASFSAPGTYVLRATANDGQLFTSRDVTITVNANGSAQDTRQQ